MSVLKIFIGIVVVIMGTCLITMALVPPAEKMSAQLAAFGFWFVAGFAVRDIIFDASVPR